MISETSLPVTPRSAGLPQHCYVVGLGVSGLVTAQWLQREGRLTAVWDDTPTQQDRARALGLPLMPPEVAYSHTADHTIDALILSPGIPHTYPLPHRVAAYAKEHNIPIIGDVELFYRAHPQATYVGITGTNGKSTTTALIYHMLATHGFIVAMGGNIGTPCWQLPSFDSPEGIYVLELSSYQLELSPSLRPNVMVVLNVTPNHLDRYADFEGYAASKYRILPSIAPQGVGYVGMHSAATTAWVEANAGGMSHVHGFRSEDLPFSLEGCPGLQGAHNQENAMAAYLVGRRFGLEVDQIVATFQTFSGLPHRQQKVGELTQKEGRLVFVNDSKATNFEAAGCALRSFQNIHWLVGGQSKKDSIHQVESYFDRIQHVYFYGRDGAILRDQLGGALPSTLYVTLEEATCAAYDQVLAHKIQGDVTILLAPACASWDQFKSFEHRGEIFAQLAQELLRPKG